MLSTNLKKVFQFFLKNKKIKLKKFRKNLKN